MRRLLLTAPPWVSVVIGALVTVALWILTFGVEGDHESGLSLVVGGCLVAGLTSAFEWRDLRRQRREVLSATGPLAPDERGAVYRAADKGTVLPDARLHRAALGLARYRLSCAVGNRTGVIVATGVLFALAAAIAVGDRSVLFGCYALGTAVMLAAALLEVPRQRRRVAQLEAGAGSPSGSVSA